MRHNGKAIWAAAVLAILVVAGWLLLPVPPPGELVRQLGQESGDDGKSGDARAVVVDVGVATVARAEDTMRTVGTVRAEERVQLGAEQAGRIAEVVAADGARVTEGDVILRFDDATEQAALQSARADLDEARRALERSRELHAEGYRAEAVLDQRAAATEQARARVSEARDLLQDTVLRAPIDGQIGLLQVSPGDYVEAGQELVELVTADSLRVSFAVPAPAAADLQVGETVRLFPAAGGETLAAVDVISPVADAESRLVEVETVVAGAVAGMRPGALVEVEVVTAVRDQAVFVPETALQWEGPTAHVFRVEDGRVRRIGVQAGVRRDGRVELAGGAVRPGQQVVVAGLQKLRDGAPVEIRNQANRQDTGPVGEDPAGGGS